MATWCDGPPRRPLIAISPDGKTVAVGGSRGKFLRLFSAADGSPLNVRNEGRPQERNQIDTQTELSALTLGPNDTLATAGTTAGGVVIKIWNLADPAMFRQPAPAQPEFHAVDAFQSARNAAGHRRCRPDRALGPDGAQPGRRAEDERSGNRSGLRAGRPDPRRRRAAREAPSSGPCKTRRHARS